MTNAYTIPVAFLVEGENEVEAAKALTKELVTARLTQDHAHDYLVGQYGSVPPGASLGPIESWWMPNHPERDTGGCGDIERVVLFVDGKVLEGEATQKDADDVIERWSRIVTAIEDMVNE